MGGQVIDGYEGPPIRDGVVLISGERIVAVGPKSEVAVPPGTTVVDTEGMSVLPGLMDMHVHLMILGHGDYNHWFQTYATQYRDVVMPISAKELRWPASRPRATWPPISTSSGRSISFNALLSC